jgi:hypothetical protein
MVNTVFMSSQQAKNSYEQAAQRACAYARSYILLGTTQLINNNYTVLEKKSLSMALSDIRNACLEFSVYLLEIDLVIRKFYQTINLCKKYSLGNCHELALMALDYVVHSAPDVEAEVVHIKGGDHVFLVVGRKINSDIKRPETWGDNAYICDPWADDVYPASEFLTKTKNFYRVKDLSTETYTNFVQNFNPLTHTIAPVSSMNTYHIRRAHSEEHHKKIFKFFEEKNSYILNAIKTLEEKLTDIAVRLIDKYGADTEKSLVIHKMILQLYATTSAISASINKEQNYSDYHQLRATLESALKQNVRDYNQAVKISTEESAILSTYHDERSLGTRLLRFFNIPPETMWTTNQALKESAEEIQIVLNTERNSWSV